MTNLGTPVSQISGIALESTPPIEEPIPDFLYLVSGGQTPAKVLEISFLDFTVNRTMVLDAGESINQTGVGDNVLFYGGYAFIPLLSTLNRIVRVDLATMTRVDHLDLTIPATGLGTAGITGAALNIVIIEPEEEGEEEEIEGYGYFICKNGLINKTDCFCKVNLDTFTEVTRIDTPDLADNCEGLLITKKTAPLSLFAFGTNFLKYDLADLVYLAKEPSAYMYLTLGVTRGDEQYGYFKSAYPYLTKVRLGGIPQKIGTISTPVALGYAVTTDMYERFSIWVDDATPAIVRKFDMYSDTWMESLTLSGSNKLYCAKRIGNYVFLGDISNPGIIYKISIDPFMFLDQSQMPTGYSAIKAIGIIE